MGNWYKVVKTIGARKYLYWQRTKRVGTSTKTENKYIGPYSASFTTESGDQFMLHHDGNYHYVPSQPHLPAEQHSREELTALNNFTEEDDERATRAQMDCYQGEEDSPYIMPPKVSSTAPETPEDAMMQIDPYAGLTDRERKKVRKAEGREDDERIQYGNHGTRARRQNAAVRAAKRATKRVKAANPSLAKAIKKPRQ